MVKKYALPAILFLAPCATRINAQQTGKILYALTTANNHSETINVDTVYFEKSPKYRLYFMNNQVVQNNKTIYTYKNVFTYSEMTYVAYNRSKYLYIYPVYENEGGPGVWSLQNGTLFLIGEKIKMAKHISYFDFFDIERINLDSLFKQGLVRLKD